MPRALFEKTGNAVWMSHLDLMRVFQRSFKRAGLLLKHTQGFNPRPSVSIALPLSVGIESRCELLDFELDGQTFPNHEIMSRLNTTLVDGVRILNVYDDGQKIKHLALLSCVITLEYDGGVPGNAIEEIQGLFSRDEVLVEKKNKNGITQQNIIPMIRRLNVTGEGNAISLDAVVSCQNPTLNPMQLAAAITQYLPDLTPDFSYCRRCEIYDTNETIFR